MNNKLDCAIVRDLLPSYADGLTSAETNAAVAAHLTDCADCAAALRRMQSPETPEPSAVPEVDYLKMLRRRSKRGAMLTGLVCALAVLGVLFVLVFCCGSDAGSDGIFCRTSVTDGQVSVAGQLTDSGRGVVRATAEAENGVVRIHVFTAPKTFFNSGELHVSCRAAGEVKQVLLGDRLLWEDGTEIKALTARLFAAASPYVGNMSANAALADILGVSEQLGAFTNELQTSQEPYGWTLRLKTTFFEKDETEIRELMKSDACVMLALIGNLGQVTWEYTTYAGEQTFTVTAQDASAAAGCDIKSCGVSAVELQKLLAALRISPEFYE